MDELQVTRIVATADALDQATWSEQIALRTAPDEVLLLDSAPPEIRDEHAIIERDHGWMGIWMDRANFEIMFEESADWVVPTETPSFAQGMISHLPVKLWLEHERVLLVVPRTLAHEFVERVTA